MASVSTSQAQEPHGMCDGTSTGQEKGWPERVFEIIMSKSFQNLTQTVNLQIQEAQ